MRTVHADKLLAGSDKPPLGVRVLERARLREPENLGGHGPPGLMLSQKRRHQVRQLSGFLKDREDVLFLILLVVSFDKAAHQVRRLMEHLWPNLFVRLEPPETLFI